MATTTNDDRWAPLGELALKIRREQRALVRQWLASLEPVEDTKDERGFWRDAGLGVEQWVVPQ